MRTRILISILAISVVLGLFSNTSLAVSKTSVNQLLTDVSWPNCNSNPSLSNSGVVGVNGGLDFSVNRCAYQESTWFNHYALYMNTGYPGIKYAIKYLNYPRLCNNHNELCLAYNYGYNAALFTLRYAALDGVYSNMWWLDVETVNSWASSSDQNVASLKGMIAAIKANTLLDSIGFYSNSVQWSVITNKWQNLYPDWVATGSLSYDDAFKACNQQFTGGLTILTQFTQRLDKDYLCQTRFIDKLLNK